MWFITDVNPALVVRVDEKRAVLFVAGEYRTDDAAEIVALRADARVSEAHERGADREPLQAREGYAVNANTGEMHDLRTAGTRCHIPEDLETAMGWKTYKRMSDAMRWNRGLDLCGFCMRGG